MTRVGMLGVGLVLGAAVVAVFRVPRSEMVAATTTTTTIEAPTTTTIPLREDLKGQMQLLDDLSGKPCAEGQVWQQARVPFNYQTGQKGEPHFFVALGWGCGPAMVVPDGVTPPAKKKAKGE